MDNIFDAADLLAIEQDAQSSSSSSSCSHAVGWGSHNAADNIPFNEDNIIINQEEPRPIESQVDDVNPSLLTKQSTQKSLIDNAQESDNDSNDDDSSEDDFLESMLALEMFILLLFCLQPQDPTSNAPKPMLPNPQACRQPDVRLPSACRGLAARDVPASFSLSRPHLASSPL